MGTRLDRTLESGRPTRVGARRVVSVAAKLAAIVLFFTAWSVIYGAMNEWAFRSPRTSYYPNPRGAFPGVIQPWTAVIYVFGGLLTPLLPFAFNRRPGGFRFVLISFTYAALNIFTLMWIFPVGMRRPEYLGTSLGERLMRAVFAMDRETNCFPSSHAMFAALSAILVAHGGAPRPVKTLTWVLAIAVCVTTVTTGQHYFVDPVAGVLTAVAGYLMAQGHVRLWGRRAGA